MSYTDLDTVSNLSGIPTADIDLLWLDWADAEIEIKMNRTFYPTGIQTVEIDGTGANMIILDTPIISVSEIDLIDNTNFITKYTNTNLTNTFIIYPSDGAIAFKGTEVNLYGSDIFPEGFKNIAITGVFGYITIPLLVQNLATLLVIKTMLVKNPDLAVNISSEKAGDVSFKYSKNNLQTMINDIYIQLNKKSFHPKLYFKE